MNATSTALVLGLGLAWCAAGIVLMRRRIGRPAGAAAVLTGLAVAGSAVLAARGREGTADLAWQTAALLCGPMALALHPSPRHGSPWHVLGLTALIGSGLVGVLGTATGSPPTATAGAVSVGLVLVAHTWWRLETSTSAERVALTWACVALMSVLVLAAAVAFVLPEGSGAPGITGLALLSLVPASLVLGTRRVLDPRVVAAGGVVLAGTAATTLAVFVLLTSVLEVVVGSPPDSGVLAVVAVVSATAFHPVRTVLRGVVDELLFGTRPDPLGAATEVAEGVGGDPDLAVRTIAAALVLPYVAVVGPDGVLAETGVADTTSRSLPLPGSDAVLVIGLRPGDAALPSQDEHVLRLTVPLLALALRAHAQAEQIAGSRAQTRAVLEEERRRLRRDLHDGLGPQLSGIAFTADAVGNLLRSDPDAAAGLVHRLRADAADAVDDVRRLVYGMRPPALDELGLVGALEQRCRSLRSPGGAALDVLVDAPEDLPPLSAAVEVAAFRIASEALTNVARHSPGSRAVLRIRADGGTLRVSVGDTGSGKDPWTAGVGTHSMRERARETGGSLAAGPTEAGGLVEAVLPLGGPRATPCPGHEELEGPWPERPAASDARATEASRHP